MIRHASALPAFTRRRLSAKQKTARLFHRPNTVIIARIPLFVKRKIMKMRVFGHIGESCFKTRVISRLRNEHHYTPGLPHAVRHEAGDPLFPGKNFNVFYVVHEESKAVEVWRFLHRLKTTNI